jgi:mono/diheme cytochrome c family protein
MKPFSSLKPRLRAGVALAVLGGAIYTLSLALVAGADTKAAKEGDSGKPAPAEKKEAKTLAKKKLSGADLYAMHCSRCHPERYATEFTAAQWKTIMIEMRVRANLPDGQAKAILKYLQEDSGTP